ncbi:hypothetical protein HK405_001865, partial [Cladochytrium tenue]
VQAGERTVKRSKTAEDETKTATLNALSEAIQTPPSDAAPSSIAAVGNEATLSPTQPPPETRSFGSPPADADTPSDRPTRMLTEPTLRAIPNYTGLGISPLTSTAPVKIKLANSK